MHHQDLSNEICQRMNTLRSDLDADVESVASSVKEKTDWRYYIRKHPWMCLTAAAALGYLLIPRREKRIVADADALAQLAKKEKLYVSQQASKAPKNNTILNQLLAFALAAGSRSAANYVSNLLNQSREKNSEPSEESNTSFAGTRPK